MYCNIWAEEPVRELPTAQIFTIIDDLRKQGTQTISFSGGEPLLREDMGEILNYCHKKDISTSMNSSGGLVAQKINQIQTLGLLKLRLDGPEEIHDKIANHKGSYQQVLQAIKAAQDSKVKTIFTATLTKYNISHLSFIMETARKYNTLVAFQPLKRLSKGLEHLEDVMPEEKEYKQAVSGLIALKRSGDESMRNSLYELEHIYHWPHYKNLRCWAGWVFCMIGVYGELYSCDRVQYKADLPNCVSLGFKKAFDNLPLTINCEGCGFCGTLELNFLLSLKLGIIGTIRKIAG
jgi:MoaA/NifB/PqqE/SkfB family radical SAM enzyme